MMLVRHAMATQPVTASLEMDAGDAAGLMAANDIGVLPVTEGDRLVGVIADRGPGPPCDRGAEEDPDRSDSATSLQPAVSRPPRRTPSSAMPAH